MNQETEVEALRRENAELRDRLVEAEDTLRAIQEGETDAVVVKTPQGERIFSLSGAETTYRLLIEAINEGTAILSKDGTIQYCNSSFTRLVKVAPERIVGCSILEFISPAAAEQVSESLQKAVTSPQRLEATLSARDQTRVEVLLSLGPYRSSALGESEISLVTTDLTEQKQLLDDIQSQRAAKDRLRASEGRLRAILEALPVGVLIADHRGRILDANPIVLSIWGLNSMLPIEQLSEFQGWNPLTGQKLRLADWPLIRAIRKGESTRDEMIEILGFDGSKKVIWINSCPVHGSRGENLGAVSVIQDITERRKAEKLREEAFAARDETVSIVTHDLKNPLAAVTLMSDLICRLASTKNEQQFLKYGTQIKHTATRMARLVSDLLDISRIESGRLMIEPGTIHSHEVLELAMVELRLLAQQKGVSIDVRLEAPAEGVFCDPQRVSQVFANLIGNALKFCEEKTGRIEIGNHVESESVVFTVRDNGPGISQEDLPHIFDRFWQATNTKKLGTGLGLALSKGIIDAHLGRIWTLSSPGKGSTFLFTLPRPGSQNATLLRDAIKAA